MAKSFGSRDARSRGPGGGSDRRGGGGGGDASRQDKSGGAGSGGYSAAEEDSGLGEVLVKVYRCTTVVKGGRRFSFAALMVVGDRQGKVGIGYGKANEVPNAVEKAKKMAARSMVRVNIMNGTLPHVATGHYGASKVRLIPASEGTGVIAGASVRAVLELAGIRNALTKCYGSTGPKNLVRATYDGLKQLLHPEDIERLRGVKLAG